MTDKELAFLRVTDPEKYKDYLAKQELKKRLAFPKLESNIDINGTFVARMYESFGGSNYVVEPDGSHYQGKVRRKKFYRRYKDECGRYKPGFWGYYYLCDDGRWFDGSGWACEKPTEQRQPVDETVEE